MKNRIGKTLVIGGGISGIQACLDLCQAGFQVLLVESSDHLGGMLSHLYHQFPTSTCGMCRILPMAGRDRVSPQCLRRGLCHENIEICLSTDLIGLEGDPGGFTAALTSRDSRNPGECPVLVVDDEKIVRDSMKEWLAEEGYPVQTAASARQALDLLAADAFQVMLTDIRMPGMDGVELLSRAKSIQPDLAVVMMTAYAAVDSAVAAMKQGAVEYLVKPFDPDAVLALVDRIFQASAADKAQKESVDAVILAAGAGFFRPDQGINCYGYGRIPGVVTNLEFEQMLSRAGSGGTHLRHPDTDRPVRRIAWFQCVGSRDVQAGTQFCSATCCMIAVKQALLAKTRYSEVADASIFYMDLRTWGKASDRYADTAARAGVGFVRARVHSLAPDVKDPDAGIRVTWVDLSGARHENDFDLVVLAPGQHPEPFTAAFARDHELMVDDRGFIRPEPFLTGDTTRPGIFACGGCTGPKDIHDSIITASAAALSAMQVMTTAGRQRLPAGVAGGPAVDGVGNGAAAGVGAGAGSGTGTRADTRAGTGAGKGSATGSGTESATGSNTGTGTGIGNGPACPEAPDVSLGPESGMVIQPRALVVGGGIAGMTAALGIADQGFEVDLVEKTNALGGNLTWLSAAIEGAGEFLARQTAAVQAHDRIRVHLNTGVSETSGRPGQWVTRLTPVPNSATGRPVDPVPGLEGRAGSKGPEASKGPEGPKGYESLESLTDPDILPGPALGSVVRHGVVVLAVGGTQAKAPGHVETGHAATGHAEADHIEAGYVQAGMAEAGQTEKGQAETVLGEANQIDPGQVESCQADPVPGNSDVPALGQGPGVYTQQQFQQALDSQAVDTAVPLQVAMIQCSGSREPGRFYCSRVCCARSLAQALFLIRQHPDTRVVIFYRDMMTIGEAEAAYTQARQAGVVFVPYEPGRGPHLAPCDAGCRITWTDPILGRAMAMDADYAVLATGIVSGLTPDLAGMFGAAQDRDGFFDQADIKWRPVAAVDPRVLACGLCLEPGGLDLVLANARAVAAKAVSLLWHKRFMPNPDTARVRAALCSLCQVCVAVCPFNARYVDWEIRTLRVDPLLCQGCGVCVAACPSGAAVVEGLSAKPMFKAIHAALDHR
jgi:heterodisulfide reductase subunit A-like polyferredoxin